MVLTVIFGAGASFDSDAENRPRRHTPEQDRPPLANELFESRAVFIEILDRFPKCHAIVPFLRGTSSIEQVLETLQTKTQSQACGDGERIRQLAAVRFYIQTVIAQCTVR